MRRAGAQFEVCRELGDVVAASDVDGIGDAGMVGGELENGTAHPTIIPPDPMKCRVPGSNLDELRD